MNFRIYIPTKGRVDNQYTLSKMPPSLHRFVTLVAPSEEASELRERYPTVKVVGQPGHIRDIAMKREYICNTLSKEEFVFMFDDDLHFYVFDHIMRKHTPGLRSPFLMEKYFTETLPALMQKYRVVGLGVKYFALPGGVKENYHLGYAFGFHRSVISKIHFNRVVTYEDIDYTLQLLRQGIRIGVSYDLVVGTRLSMAAGGCSDERTPATIDRDVDKLVALHPGLVEKKPLRPGAKHLASNTKIWWKRAAKEGGM